MVKMGQEAAIPVPRTGTCPDDVRDGLRLQRYPGALGGGNHPGHDGKGVSQRLSGRHLWAEQHHPPGGVHEDPDLHVWPDGTVRRLYPLDGRPL